MSNNLEIVKVSDVYNASIKLSKNEFVNTKTTDKPELITILDVSGSMRSCLRKVLESLKMTYLQMGYSMDDKINIITFSSVSKLINIKISELKNIETDGLTFMKETVNLLVNYLIEKSIKHVRILVLSDGALNDSRETINALENVNIFENISCHLVGARIYNYADTRALATWLILDNVSKTKNLIEWKNENTSKVISELYNNDGLEFTREIVSEEEIFMNQPFEKATKTMKLKEGDNNFWIKSISTDIKIEGVKMNINIHELEPSIFEEYVNKLVVTYIQKLKVLKVVNTNRTENEIKNILDFFTKVEMIIENNNCECKDASLRSRRINLINMAKRRQKSLFYQLKCIANDDKIQRLSSEQQANWIRTDNISKSNSKRMIKKLDGQDLDTIVKDEVGNIHKNLYSLEKELKESNVDLLVSFVSCESVLDGLQSVSETVEDKSLEYLGHLDILKLISIVGIACDGVIGEHTDPMTYRINKVYPNVFVSISDILMSHGLGMELEPPGQKECIINNCVPVVHPIIFKFMKKYCPHILELSAGYGMRGFIGEINMTNTYTIANGLWCMVMQINNDKSSINISTFETLIETFRIAIGSYFKHLAEYMVNQEPEHNYFINNNGITNMLSTLIDLSKTGEFNNIHRVYSSLYSFEYYQRTRRLVKYNAGDLSLNIYRNNIIKKLLYVNPDQVPGLTELFEEDIEPDWDNWTVDIKTEYFEKEYKKEFWYIPYLTLVFDYLRKRYSSSVSEEFIKKQLNIEYPVVEFELYNMVCALLFYEKSLRVKDDKCMLTPDFSGPGGRERGHKMCQKYVSDYLQKIWLKNKSEKNLEENELIVVELINNMCVSSTADFIQALNSEHKRNVKVEYPSLIYSRLRDSLLNKQNKCENRMEKILILITGKFNEDIVFNEGKMIGDKRSNYSGPLSQFDNVPQELNIAVSKLYEFRYRSGRDIPTLLKAFNYPLDTKNADFTNRHNCGIILEDGKVYINGVYQEYF